MNEIIYKKKKTGKLEFLWKSTAEDAEGDAFAGYCSLLLPRYQTIKWSMQEKVEKVESVDWQKSTGLVHIGPVSFKLHEPGTNDKHLNSPQRRLSIYWIKNPKKIEKEIVYHFLLYKIKQKNKKSKTTTWEDLHYESVKGTKRNKRARRDEIKIENSFSHDIMWTRFLSFESTQQKQFPIECKARKEKKKKRKTNPKM
jgi:hypothetical protein